MAGGCGVPFSFWDEVVRLLDGRATARMDRPGLAGTRWPDTLPTLAAEVATLAALVDRIGGPVIMVGHSMAGLQAEALVRLRPDLVCGLVLVDSSVEWRTLRTGPLRLWLRLARLVRWAAQLPVLDHLGSLAARIMVISQTGRAAPSILSRPTLQLFRNPQALAMIIAEQASYPAQIEELRELRERTAMPVIPTVVLTAAGDGGERWVVDQHRLSVLLAARQIVLEDARHLVMIDRPDAVVAAVRSIGQTEGDQ
nr:alpha/beta hydrolase [Microlunatus panaciterrae]